MTPTDHPLVPDMGLPGESPENGSAPSGSERDGETREQVVAEALGLVVEIIEQARSAVSREATEMRREVIAEVKQALTRIEALAAKTVSAALAKATAPVESAPSGEPVSPTTNGASARAGGERKRRNKGN